MTRAPAVTVSGLTIRFEGFTLGPLDVGVARGERVALVGANGAGKSTLLKALAGRILAYEGSVRVLEHEARQAPAPLRGRVGLLGEELLGFGWMTVAEHLALLADVHPGWDRAYARTLVERLAVPRDTKLANLSRGSRVKVALVSAEAFRPPLLLLDEPTSGIDPVVRSELLTLLDEVAPPGGERTLVYSTHLLEDVEAVADRVLLLREGRVLLDAATVVARARSPVASLPDALRGMLAGA